MTEPSHAVFLSYASQDAQAAQKICEALRAAGIEVWFDQSELRGGDAWDQSIRRQIKTCALFIPVVSKNTHDRDEGYFRLEWKLAVDRCSLMAADRTFLLPVVVDDTRDDDERVPERFRDVQWTRLPGGSAPPSFVERVRRLLSPEPAHPPSTAARSSSAVSAATPATRVLPHSRWLRPALLVLALLLVVAGTYLALDRFVLSKRSVAAPTAVADKSIAVLPFSDLSEKRDQEYFADGLAEEIVDLLAKIPGLKVVGRTSSFQFKSNSADLRKNRGDARRFAHCRGQRPQAR